MVSLAVARRSVQGPMSRRPGHENDSQARFLQTASRPFKDLSRIVHTCRDIRGHGRMAARCTSLYTSRGICLRIGTPGSEGVRRGGANDTRVDQ
jgi:hypothetical protein